MSKSKPMTSKAASRIQSTTAKAGSVTKGSFPSRAQSSAAKKK